MQGCVSARARNHYHPGQRQTESKTALRTLQSCISIPNGSSWFPQDHIATLDRETNEYLEQRYAEGKDAVGLLERTRSGWEGVSGEANGSSGSREGRGGLWPFGGGKSSDARCGFAIAPPRILPKHVPGAAAARTGAAAAAAAAGLAEVRRRSLCEHMQAHSILCARAACSTGLRGSYRQ